MLSLHLTKFPHWQHLKSLSSCWSELLWPLPLVAHWGQPSNLAFTENSFSKPYFINFFLERSNYLAVRTNSPHFLSHLSFPKGQIPQVQYAILCHILQSGSCLVFHHIPHRTVSLCMACPLIGKLALIPFLSLFSVPETKYLRLGNL